MPVKVYEKEKVTLRPILKDNKDHPICDAASSITAESITATSKNFDIISKGVKKW